MSQPEQTPSINIPDVAAAVSQNGTMGIAGAFSRTVMNMSAMAILACGAVGLTWVFVSMAKDDREMFREELKAIRIDANDRYLRTEATHGKSMEKMGATIERAVGGMEKATRALEATASKIPDGERCP